MHIQRCADAVACPVAVVEALPPERRAGERVERAAGSALGEDGDVQRDVTLSEAKGGRGTEPSR